MNYVSYLDLINAFESWCERNQITPTSKVIWYTLISLFNKSGWCEWLQVDNDRLMCLSKIKREHTFIDARNRLIQLGFFEYKKGKKGNPSQYKIKTDNFNKSIAVKIAGNTAVKTAVKTAGIYRDRIRVRKYVSDYINKIISQNACVKKREDLNEYASMQIDVLEDTLYDLLLENKENIIQEIKPDDLDLIRFDVEMPMNYFKKILENKYGRN